MARNRRTSRGVGKQQDGKQRRAGKQQDGKQGAGKQ
jgi:hypothetical protein